ncbi:lytic transglycosylase domain-containing protein [Leifsonia sp. A12D58]|uniref:aggregation-promoting factor C-terminal-like domain-containing protein n=1 Tax=Leifsonia sp. A12D58 TaxID=3397674 RepID=UPI0039E1D98D
MLTSIFSKFRSSDSAADADRSTTSIDTTGAADGDPSRAQLSQRRRNRKRLLMAGSFVVVGAVTGTGFAVQSTVADQNQAAATAKALEESERVATMKLTAYTQVVEDHAEHKAKNVIDGANVVLAAATGKTDTTPLVASVTALSDYTLLAPPRIYELASETKVNTDTVRAAMTEVDRIAAEQAAAAAVAAAAEAAAEKAAAEQAAADKAAAEEAAPSTGSGSSAPSRPSAPTDPTGAQAIARDLMASQYGWGEDQFGCLVSLWAKESGWNVNAYNSSSGAAGIPQALPGSKMASAGADWQTNPATQITWGLGYIAGRYGTPCAAWDSSVSSGWY